MPNSLDKFPAVSLADCLQTAKPRDLIITGSTRMARELRRSFATLGTRLVPRILPYHAWLADSWQRLRVEAAMGGDLRRARTLLLSDSQEEVLWHKVLRETGAADHFLFLDETVAACMRSQRLFHAYQLPRDHDSWQRSTESQLFLEWLTAVEAECVRNGWRLRAQLPSIVSEGAASFRHLRGSQVFLAGFDEASPEQVRLFDSIAGSGASVAIVEKRKPFDNQRVLRFAAADAEAEWRAAAAWAVEKVRANPDGNFAVVIPELAQNCTRIQQIFAEAFVPSAPWCIAPLSSMQFHISYAPPLARNPLAEGGLRLLDALDEEPTIEVLRYLLRSPWLAGAEAERESRSRFEAALLTLRRDRLPWGTLITLASQADGGNGLQAWRAVLTAMAAIVEELRLSPERSPSAWVALVRTLWTRTLWIGPPALSSEEFQARHRILNELGAMEELDAVLPSCGLNEFTRNVRRRFDAAGFQPDAPLTPVLVAGLFEVSGLSFDACWIGGLNDKTLPRPTAPDPFLPLELQRESALPRSSAAHELEFASKLFSRNLTLAPDLTLSFASRSGDEEQEASPLLLSLDAPWIEHSPASASAGNADEPPAVWEQFSDRWGGVLPTHTLRVPGGVRVLADQSACPFRAFVQARLESDSLEWEAPLMNRMDQGSQLHKALEAFWRKTGSREALLQLQDETLLERVSQCVDLALESYTAAPDDKLAEAQKFAERERLIALLLEWMEHELGREPFTVEQLERGRLTDMGGFTLSLRPDRVDRLQDGSLALIDYKSGSVSPKKWLGERPEEPQLLLYLASETERVGALAFASFKPGALGWSAYGKNLPADFLPGTKPEKAAPPGGWDQFVTEGIQAVDQLVAEFRDGFAPVNPRNGTETCKFCAQQPFCRIGEALMLEDDDPDMGEDS